VHRLIIIPAIPAKSPFKIGRFILTKIAKVFGRKKKLKQHYILSPQSLIMK